MLGLNGVRGAGGGGGNGGILPFVHGEMGERLCADGAEGIKASVPSQYVRVAPGRHGV